MYALEAGRLSTSPEKTGGWVASVFASRIEDETHNREPHNSNTEHGSHHWTRHAAIMARLAGRPFAWASVRQCHSTLCRARRAGSQ
jgi:hypothetical protein